MSVFADVSPLEPFILAIQAKYKRSRTPTSPFSGFGPHVSQTELWKCLSLKFKEFVGEAFALVQDEVKTLVQFEKR